MDTFDPGFSGIEETKSKSQILMSRENMLSV